MIQGGGTITDVRIREREERERDRDLVLASFIEVLNYVLSNIIIVQHLAYSSV